MLSWRVVSTLALVLYFATPAQAQVPAGVTVRNVSYAGTLCPQGSIAAHWHKPAVQSVLRFYMDSLIVETGPGVPLKQKRKNCSVSLDLVVPSGWTYAVESFSTFVTYMVLDQDVTAQVKVKTPLRSGLETTQLSASMAGPLNRAQNLRSATAEPLVFLPCARPGPLSFSAESRVDSLRSNRHGLLTGDSVDSSPGIDLKLVFKRCGTP